MPWIPLAVGGAALVAGMVGSSAQEKGYNAAGREHLGGDKDYANNRQKQYDNQGEDAYRQSIAAGQNVDQSQFNQQYANNQDARGQQNAFLQNDMLAAARGDTSAAKAMSAYNTDATTRQLASMQASRRGPLGNTNALAGAAVDAGLRNNQQSMGAAAQEKAAAQQAYMGGVGAMRAGDQSMAATSGQFALGRTQANLQGIQQGAQARLASGQAGDRVVEAEANLGEQHNQRLDAEGRYQADKSGEEWKMLGNVGASMLASGASGGGGGGGGKGGSDMRIKTDISHGSRTTSDERAKADIAPATWGAGAARDPELQFRTGGPNLQDYIDEHVAYNKANPDQSTLNREAGSPAYPVQPAQQAPDSLYGHPEEDEAIARLMGQAEADKRSNAVQTAEWEHKAKGWAADKAGELPQEDTKGSGFQFKYQDFWSNGPMTSGKITSDAHVKKEKEKTAAAMGTLNALLSSLQQTGTLTPGEAAKLGGPSTRAQGARTANKLVDSLEADGRFNAQEAASMRMKPSYDDLLAMTQGLPQGLPQAKAPSAKPAARVAPQRAPLDIDHWQEPGTRQPVYFAREEYAPQPPAPPRQFDAGADEYAPPADLASYVSSPASKQGRITSDAAAKEEAYSAGMKAGMAKQWQRAATGVATVASPPGGMVLGKANELSQTGAFTPTTHEGHVAKERLMNTEYARDVGADNFAAVSPGFSLTRAAADVVGKKVAGRLSPPRTVPQARPQAQPVAAAAGAGAAAGFEPEAPAADPDGGITELDNTLHIADVEATMAMPPGPARTKREAYINHQAEQFGVVDEDGKVRKGAPFRKK